MADDDDRSLILPSPFNLGRTAPGAQRIVSEMVKHMLSDIRRVDASKAVYSVLIGDHDEEIAEVYKGLIELATDDHSCTIDVVRCGDESSLIQAASQRRFDLYIAGLDNIEWSSPAGQSLNLKQRVEKCADLVTHLKAAYGKPVIVCCDYFWNHAYHSQRVRNAGADALLARFDPVGFREVIHSLISDPSMQLSPRRRELYGCMWRDAEYWQISLWARALQITREQVCERLIKSGTIIEEGAPGLPDYPPGYEQLVEEALSYAAYLVRSGVTTPDDIVRHFTARFNAPLWYLEKVVWHATDGVIDWEIPYALMKHECEVRQFHSEDGRERLPAQIAKLRWCLDLLPLDEFKSVKGLCFRSAKIDLGSESGRKPRKLKLSLPHVERLDCSRLGLIELDLSEMPQLRVLNCEHNEIATLDVSPLKYLTDLRYDDEKTRLVKCPDQQF